MSTTALSSRTADGSGPGSDQDESPHLRARLCGRDGTTIALDVAGWAADADALERRQLADLDGPVLDIGCGPGRLVVALAERGVAALGVDASPAAVRLAVGRQATALVRSVFEPLPGTGRWRSALLFDGNIGIGGDPLRLLQRTHALLAVGGVALVETAPPGIDLHRFEARVERGGAVSAWFPWARLGVQALVPIAVEAGFDVGPVVQDDDRWFVELIARP